MAEQLTIVELAERTGISVRTIRFYAGMDLIPPPQVRGRLGLYDERHVARLELVRDLQGLGFT
ncbi:MAG: MerR family transcriptional regulator, partial [Pseudonocardiaceae bacterium]